MKCNEQLYRNDDTYSSRDCQLELGHTGAHEYFGEKFPRPKPTGDLAPEIRDLIEEAARKRGVWGLDEMQWPIVVEVTNVYVIKAPGATEDEALGFWGDGDYPDLDGEQAIDGSFEVRRIDKYERSGMAGYSPHGPMIACPDCAKLAMSREWYHDPYRKCHGPIEWRENAHSRSPQYRYRREFKATPVAEMAGAR